MAKSPLYNRRFFRMLFTLSPQRREDFAAYISLRQFNPQPSLGPLLHAILACGPNPADPVTLEDLGAASKMAPSTVEKSISQLRSLLGDFMLVRAALERKETLHQLPFEAWLDADLDEGLAEGEFKQRKRRLQKLPVTDGRLYEELLLELSMAKVRAKQPRRDQADLFDRHLLLLDNHHVLARLKYTCAAVNAARIFGSSEAQPLRDWEPGPAAEQLPPVGHAYWLLLQLLRSKLPQPADIRSCLDFLSSAEGELDPEDSADLYGYLLNTGFRGMATGDPVYDELVHEVYAVLVEKGLLLEKGTLNGTHFKNIVTVKVRTGRLEAARTFIGDHRGDLKMEERELVAPFCMGLVEFHAGDFLAAIREFSALVRHSPDDLFWGLEGRSMLWKAYFEAYDSLNEEEHGEMLRLYDSFRNFVARNQQLSDYHRKGYLNFIRLFNRLVCLTEERAGQGKLAELLEQAEGTEMVVNKKWLLGAIRRKIDTDTGTFQ